MMVVIVYGNGLSAISRYVSDFKKRFEDLSIQEISGKNISFEQALVDLSTPSFFSEKRLVILEDFDEKELNLEAVGDDENLTILIRINKQVSKESLLLKTAALKKYQTVNLSEKDEKLIFPFLDHLFDKNPRVFTLFEKLYLEYGGQYLLTMIFYGLRRMVLPISGSSFMIQKLEKQKKNFKVENIEELYKKALEVDFKVKSGLMEEKIGLTLFLDGVIRK